MKTKHLARARFARTSAEGGGGGQQQAGGDDQQQQQSGPEMAKDADGADLGYPKNTAIADMKPEQQANYWRTESKKQQKAREAAERERDEAKRNNGQQQQGSQNGNGSGNVSNQQTQPDATADAARREGRREAARDAVLVSMSTALQMRGKNPDEITELLEVVNPDKFLDPEAKIDGTRVANYVARVAPASGNQQQGLPGQGRQQQQQGPTAKAAAKAAAERRGLVSSDANRGALGGLRK